MPKAKRGDGDNMRLIIELTPGDSKQKALDFIMKQLIGQDFTEYVIRIEQ